MSRTLIIALSICILALLLACTNQDVGGAPHRYAYEICGDTNSGRVCHTVYLSVEECQQQYSQDICRQRQ